jgi:hypothetical protein
MRVFLQNTKDLTVRCFSGKMENCFELSQTPIFSSLRSIESNVEVFLTVFININKQVIFYYGIIIHGT